MGNDVDDALALAVLHSLQSRGACKLLAVTLTRVDPWSARFTDAVNTFYGRPEIPIGVKRDGKFADPSAYLKVAEKFPHRINPDKAPDCRRAHPKNAPVPARWLSRDCPSRLFLQLGESF